MIVASQFVLKDEWKLITHSLLLTNLSTQIYGFQVRLHTNVFAHQKDPYANPAWFAGRWRASIEDRFGDFLFTRTGPSTYVGEALIPVLPDETVRIDCRVNSPWKADKVRSLTGYLELAIPMVDRGGGTLEQQGDEPVPVLLHSFRDWEEDASPVAASAGGSLVDIVPDQEKGWVIPASEGHVGLGRIDSAGAEAVVSLFDAAGFLEAPGSLEKVLMYVGQVGESTDNIARFNELLAEAGHSVRLTTSR